MLNAKGVDPCVDFSEVVPSALPAAKLWIKMRDPVAVCAFGGHEADGRVENILIIVRKPGEIGRLSLLSQHFRQLGNAPVVIAAFDCD
jgi:hypothetical protein